MFSFFFNIFVKYPQKYTLRCVLRLCHRNYIRVKKNIIVPDFPFFYCIQIHGRMGAVQCFAPMGKRILLQGTRSPNRSTLCSTPKLYIHFFLTNTSLLLWHSALCVLRKIFPGSTWIGIVVYIRVSFSTCHWNRDSLF